MSYFYFTVTADVGCGETCHRVVNFSPWMSHQSDRLDRDDAVGEDDKVSVDSDAIVSTCRYLYITLVAHTKDQCVAN